MVELARFRGIVHHVSGSLVIGSRGASLYRSQDEGHSWRPCGTLPASGRWRFSHFGRLTRRLARAFVWHVLPVDDELWVALSFGGVFRVRPRTGAIERIGTIAGSRPLRACVMDRTLLYGEYRSNTDRQPIAIWAVDVDTGEPDVVTRLSGVRHVHGIFRDPYSEAIWMTTGDEDSESSIGRLNIDAGTFTPVASGSQQTRAVDLVFTEDAVWFGSDAPDNTNYLFRLDRISHELQRLQRVGGPVFYGAAAGNRILFSTVVEPSKVNRNRFAELWLGERSGREWHVLCRRAKDPWPKRLFQYGQFLIPAITGDPGMIWVTPLSIVGDQVSIGFRL